jgi:hypothetical protein
MHIYKIFKKNEIRNQMSYFIMLSNYEDTVIYKISCKDLLITDFYIGSTKNFYKRYHVHKTNCIQASVQKLYIEMNKNGGFSNYEMVIIEKFPCANRQQKHMREQYHIDCLGPKLNTIRAFRTNNERLNEMKDYNKVYQNELSVESKEKYKENRHNHYLQIRDYAIARTQEYRVLHLDERLIYEAAYRLKKRDSINEKYRRKKQADLEDEQAELEDGNEYLFTNW